MLKSNQLDWGGGELRSPLGLKSSSARKPSGPAAMFVEIPNKRCMGGGLSDFFDFLSDIGGEFIRSLEQRQDDHYASTQYSIFNVSTASGSGL